MKDTDHHIRHPRGHTGDRTSAQGTRGCAWRDDQFGRGQNTALGWSDPTLGHCCVPKVSRVAPAQHEVSSGVCASAQGEIVFHFFLFRGFCCSSGLDCSRPDNQVKPFNLGFATRQGERGTVLRPATVDARSLIFAKSDQTTGTMQALLGHSAPEITREIYLHAIPEEQRRAVESVERLVFWTQIGPSLVSNAEGSWTVH
jgi:hypothetical protein